MSEEIRKTMKKLEEIMPKVGKDGLMRIVAYAQGYAAAHAACENNQMPNKPPVVK